MKTLAYIVVGLSLTIFLLISISLSREAHASELATPEPQRQARHVLTLTRTLSNGTHFGVPIALWTFNSLGECTASANLLNTRRRPGDTTRYGCS